MRHVLPLLVVAGTLDRRYLGPTIGTEDGKIGDPNDSKLQNLEYGYVFTDLRRSVYTPAFRNQRLELFEAFDFGSNNLAIAKRNTSTVAPQALYMMNHPFVIEQSRATAKRLLSNKALGDNTARLDRLYESALGRLPTERERQLTSDFVQVSAGEPDAQEAAEQSWSLLAQSIFASVDFRYIE